MYDSHSMRHCKFKTSERRLLCRILGRPHFRFHHPTQQFILRIRQNPKQIRRSLAKFLRQQFLPFEDSVNAYEKMVGLHRASKVELLAVLVNQDVTSVICIATALVMVRVRSL